MVTDRIPAPWWCTVGPLPARSALPYHWRVHGLLRGRRRQQAGRPSLVNPDATIQEVQGHEVATIRPGRRPPPRPTVSFLEAELVAELHSARPASPENTGMEDATVASELLPPLHRGRTRRAPAGHVSDHPPRMRTAPDTSVCIGCKACEVSMQGVEPRYPGGLPVHRDVLRQHGRIWAPTPGGMWPIHRAKQVAIPGRIRTGSGQRSPG